MKSFGNKIIPGNFGDDINYALVKYLSNNKYVINIRRNILFEKKLNILNYACIGSIIDTYLNKNTIVWGSGSMEGKIENAEKPLKICSVRGPLTRQVLLKNGIDCPENYGDPALLLPMIFPCKQEKKYKYGLIPHICDYKLPNISIFREKYKESAIIIDLKNYVDWHDIVIQINQCEYIISSSLHGLIISDAYGIPNIWIKLSNNIIGGNFKFLDYFASVNREQKKPVDLVNKPIIAEDVIKQYQYHPITFDTDTILKSCPFYHN